MGVVGVAEEGRRERGEVTSASGAALKTRRWACSSQPRARRGHSVPMLSFGKIGYSQAWWLVENQVCPLRGQGGQVGKGRMGRRSFAPSGCAFEDENEKESGSIR